LSAIDCSLIGNLCGSVLGRYALQGDRVRLSGVVVVGSAAAVVDPEHHVVGAGEDDPDTTGDCWPSRYTGDTATTVIVRADALRRSVAVPA